jgi:hypothetical protein
MPTAAEATNLITPLTHRVLPSRETVATARVATGPVAARVTGGQQWDHSDGRRCWWRPVVTVNGMGGGGAGWLDAAEQRAALARGNRARKLASRCGLVLRRTSETDPDRAAGGWRLFQCRHPGQHFGPIGRDHWVVYGAGPNGATLEDIERALAAVEDELIATGRLAATVSRRRRRSRT